MTLRVKASGSWRDVTPHVRVSGTWRTCKEVWVKASGSWRSVWTAANPPIWTAGTSVSRTGSSSFGIISAILNISSTGVLTLTDGTNGTWLPSGASAGNYRIKWSFVSGHPVYGSWTVNTWATLSSSRTLSVAADASESNTSTVDVTIEETATGASITKRITITATNTASGGGGFPQR